MSELAFTGLEYVDSTPQDKIWDSLTNAQKQAIKDGPGWLTEPVEQVDFEDVDSFREDLGEGVKSNNFKMYFQETDFGRIMRKAEPYKRIEIIDPKTVQQLRAKMIACNNIPDSAEIWQDLLKMYRVMRYLVDKNDPGVMQFNKPDKEFLIR